jgi:hypothetical protein
MVWGKFTDIGVQKGIHSIISPRGRVALINNRRGKTAPTIGANSVKNLRASQSIYQETDTDIDTVTDTDTDSYTDTHRHR